MNLRDEILERERVISQLKHRLENKIAQLPEGRVHCRHLKSRTYYFESQKHSKEQPLGKNDEKRLKELLQREYFEKVIKSTNEELVSLKKIRKQYPELLAEDIYGLIPDDRRKWIRPILLPDDQFIKEWQTKPYQPKPFRKDDPVYITMRGERVRSKSEMIIADRLYANNIPYKYECPIQINGILIHPDFTILRIQDRKDLYLEHCGRIGNEDYSDDFVDRINLYSENGIIIGDRLFLTFETANKPFDVRTIDRLINGVFTQNRPL